VAARIRELRKLHTPLLIHIIVSVLTKKDIVSSELEACENLLKCTTDEPDRQAIESEIIELKMALDLMP
jgi:hypothetical protein